MDKVPVTIETIGFLARSRVLRTSWCPDKDLLVVVIHVAGKDKLGLWKMTGSKKWEVDIERESAEGQTIVDIAWSPDGKILARRVICTIYKLNHSDQGQYIAVAHNPPLITLHSLQTGRQERTLSIPSQGPKACNLTHIWWMREHRTDKKANIPDMFKRGGDIVSTITRLPNDVTSYS
jgi:anaphase-promoting complex subunit 4